MKDIFFKKRIPEPKIMEKKEMSAFEDIAKENFKMWFEMLADYVFQRTKIRSGSILDLACGPGFLTKALGKQFSKSKIYGVDISNPALVKARSNCSNLKNVEFKKTDACNLPYENNFFDLIVCRDSFHHFDDPKKVILESVRVLKKGGFLFIQDLRRDLPSFLLERITPPKTIFEKLQYYSARAAYLKDEIKKMFFDLGMKNVHVLNRRVTKATKDYCIKNNIDIKKLKVSFGSHYIACVKVK